MTFGGWTGGKIARGVSASLSDRFRGHTPPGAPARPPAGLHTYTQTRSDRARQRPSEHERWPTCLPAPVPLPWYVPACPVLGLCATLCPCRCLPVGRCGVSGQRGPQARRGGSVRAGAGASVPGGGRGATARAALCVRSAWRTDVCYQPVDVTACNQKAVTERGIQAGLPVGAGLGP